MKTFDLDLNDTKENSFNKTNDLINFNNNILFPNYFPLEINYPNLPKYENDTDNPNFFFQPPPDLPNQNQNLNDMSLFNFSEELDKIYFHNLSLSENFLSSSFFKKQEEINKENKNSLDSQKNKFEIISKNNNKNKYFRVDSAKIHFKVAVSQFFTEQINFLIKKSKLPKKLKKKIHLPHFKKFTSNPKEFDNFQFLSFDLKQILTFGKTEENLQGNNDKKIMEILEYKKHPEKKKEIIDFLSLKYEEIIKLFYKSQKFNKFKENEMTKFFADGIKKEKNISLLEDDGLIKLFKMTNKKRKRKIFFSR